ncbi:MAG: hypothetical protein ACR2QF_08865 [Geminicoccaceae bacterium]
MRGRCQIGKPETRSRVPKDTGRIRDRAYRESAKDRDCMCCGKPGHAGEVVLCHLNFAGNFGRGLKASDDESLFLCSWCHTIMDTDPNRSRWIVQNIVVPQRREAYQRWKQGR